MSIAKDLVVSFQYVLTDPSGEVLDRSEPGEPLEYLHGHDNIIPGLERALESKQVGDRLKVEVPPEDGYGPLDPEKQFSLSRKHFGKSAVAPGMMVELTPHEGHAFMARVVEVGEKEVSVDANHPMAGRRLCFEVEVMAIRPATPEEIEHGHVHGPHGHHHHH